MCDISQIYPQGFEYLIIFLVFGHLSTRTRDEDKTCPPPIFLAFGYLGMAKLGDIRKKKMIKVL